MNKLDWQRVELAIRIAASQMPGGASKQFRLVADELKLLNLSSDWEVERKLTQYRDEQSHLD